MTLNNDIFRFRPVLSAADQEEHHGLPQVSLRGAKVSHPASVAEAGESAQVRRAHCREPNQRGDCVTGARQVLTSAAHSCRVPRQGVLFQCGQHHRPTLHHGPDQARSFVAIRKQRPEQQQEHH